MSTLGALVHDVEHAKSSTAISNEAFIVAVLKLKSSWKAEAPMLWWAVANTSAQHSVTEACLPCRPHCLRSLSSQSCSVSWPRDGSRLPKVPTRRERPHTLQGCLGHVFTSFVPQAHSDQHPPDSHLLLPDVDCDVPCPGTPIGE